MGEAGEYRGSHVGTVTGASAGVDKLELHLMNCWRLRVDKTKNYKLQEDPVIGGPLQYHEIYLQELDQIPKINIGEKSPPASGRERKKNHSEIYWSTLFFLTRPALQKN